MSQLFDILDKRGSRYQIVKDESVTQKEILDVVETAIQKTPSAFNAQTQRAVVLFDENSDKFWDITLDELRKVAPAEGFENTVAKIDAFKLAKTTILYYTDTAVTKALQEQFALYADNFPVWAQQENGMFQLVVWSSLDSLGLGGSLQHYNPLVDKRVREEFDIPESWTLLAQMPVGKPLDEHQIKEKSDVKAKVLTF